MGGRLDASRILGSGKNRLLGRAPGRSDGLQDQAGGDVGLGDRSGLLGHRPPVAQPVGILDPIYEMLTALDTGSGYPPTINMNSAFAAPGGGYTEYLPRPHGQQVQVRTPDRPISHLRAKVYLRRLSRER